MTSQDSHLWLRDLAQAIKDPRQLLEALNLNPEDFTKDLPARTLFPVFVPRPFLAKMAKNDPSDPLFLQVMCQQGEFLKVAGFSQDPLEEQHFPAPGILHKYHNRLLFMIKNSCGVNCRYCFRRHFPYGENKGSKENWLKSLDYIKSHEEIEEVIFSGGDPLMAKDHEWQFLIERLAKIPHLTRLRIHTRLPVVIPNRITADLCEILTRHRLQMVVVTHINHPNEIGEDLRLAMAKLNNAGITLLNQSVLLKGINDDADILKALNDKLFSAGILPYYLHLLDKVEGASHFYLEDDKALSLYHALQAKSSGFLVPKLAREIAGRENKTLFA